MKIKQKRAFSLLLAVAIYLTLLPAMAFAAEVDTYYVDLDGKQYSRTSTVIGSTTKS